MTGNAHIKTKNNLSAIKSYTQALSFFIPQSKLPSNITQDLKKDALLLCQIYSNLSSVLNKSSKYTQSEEAALSSILHSPMNWEKVFSDTI